ncbi:hypothetical protein BGZ81_007560 [Podila clonocystis]|nr:hypothetical protein BGZ81_007560 [Podila clonocystis]
MDVRFSHVDQRRADNFMETLPRLSSFNLDLRVPAHQSPSTALSRHYGALTSMSLTSLPMTQIFSIVSTCAVLRELAVDHLVIQGSESETSPRWICPLQKLHLHIVYGVEMGHVLPGEDITLRRVRERRSAEQVAPSFMAQVGSMTKLNDLKLKLQWDDRLGTSPFFELSLDPIRGLPQLSELRQLTSVALLGTRHSIVMAWRETYNGQVPKYSQWFPGLQVVVPDHCYSCWSNPTAFWADCTYHDYSRTTHGQQALLKNAMHIRALTCYSPHSLQILRASNCVNLVEINYLIDSLNSVELTTVLGSLAKLIILNPQLTAVSIEGINLGTGETRDTISRFLDFLDEHPRITCVYFDSGLNHKNSHIHHWKDVWYRLLSRVSASTIHSVQAQSHTTRSNRGTLHGRRAWIARESPIRVKIVGSELRRKRRGPVGGRWESEYRHP